MTFSAQSHRSDTIARQRRLYGPSAIERWRENAEAQRVAAAEAEAEKEREHRAELDRLREEIASLQTENITLRFRHPGKIVRDAIGKAYGFTTADLLAYRRQDALVYARQTAMAHVLYRTGLSLPAVGRLFNRDHTTVLHAKRIFDADIAAMAAKVEARFRQIEAGEVEIVKSASAAVSITDRQTQALRLFREGKDTVEIAHALGVKESVAANALGEARRSVA